MLLCGNVHDLEPRLRPPVVTPAPTKHTETLIAAGDATDRSLETGQALVHGERNDVVCVKLVRKENRARREQRFTGYTRHLALLVRDGWQLQWCMPQSTSNSSMSLSLQPDDMEQMTTTKPSNKELNDSDEKHQPCQHIAANILSRIDSLSLPLCMEAKIDSTKPVVNATHSRRIPRDRI